jgi:hypothetical protein
VTAAVERLGRPVRAGEVLEHLCEEGASSGFGRVAVFTALGSLAQHGELTIVGRVSGSKVGGRSLYLPSTLDPREYPVREPLSWPERVFLATETAWSARSALAGEAGLQPKPFTTNEIVAAVREREDEACERIPIVDALIPLTRGRQPRLRVIRGGSGERLWCPSWVDTDTLDLRDVYRHDTERLVVAIRRASKRLGRPCVSSRQVAAEIDADAALRLIGRRPLSKLLDSAARETLVDNGGRRARKHRVILRVGLVGPTAYYALASDLSAAQAYLRFLDLDRLWVELDAVAESIRIGACPSRSYAAVRSRDLVLRLRALTWAFVRLSHVGVLPGDVIDVVSGRVKEVRTLRRAVSLGLAPTVAARYPRRTCLAPATWTSAEYGTAFREVAPGARDCIEQAAPALPWDLHLKVARSSNPAFQSKFSGDPTTASRELIDRTSALLLLGERFGGRECRFQALLASRTLGNCRDPRPALDELRSPDIGLRLAAVACLAFLRPPEAAARLGYVAAHDVEPGVRESARWALGVCV